MEQEDQRQPQVKCLRITPAGQFLRTAFDTTELLIVITEKYELKNKNNNPKIQNYETMKRKY